MKFVWKLIKGLFKWTFILLFLFAIGVFVFMNTSAEFGGDHSDEDIRRYEKTGHYKEAVFFNPVETTRGFSWDVFVKTFKEYLKENPNRDPQVELPLVKQDSLKLEQTKNESKLIWFGHSAFLLQLDGKNILLDPMLGEAPSPVKWLSRKRYSKELPLAIAELPQIDFVFISHDHYDHLDLETIDLIKDKVGHFIVPIGVGAHFKSWDVPASKIHEFNWWEDGEVNGLEFAFTPTRHFSGRGITDANATLWGSWVIKGKDSRVFFSGDSGYGDHFKKIGDTYGPFDFALVECGQYNDNWKQIHMRPEESAQAVKDLNAKVGIPIHWGAFTLSLHDWFEPPVRIKKAADSLGVNVVTPVIGETIDLDSLNIRYNPWWESL